MSMETTPSKHHHWQPDHLASKKGELAVPPIKCEKQWNSASLCDEQL
jgi:hypothetical protein